MKQKIEIGGIKGGQLLHLGDGWKVVCVPGTTHQLNNFWSLTCEL